MDNLLEDLREYLKDAGRDITSEIDLAEMREELSKEDAQWLKDNLSALLVVLHKLEKEK